MKALILDTETHVLNGLPIQIAYAPCSLERGGLAVDDSALFDELFSIDQNKIDYGAMAVHHIIEADLVGKPSYKTFALPHDCTYIIGHNIEYDIEAIKRCGVKTEHLKPICTLALARAVFPEAPNHKLSTLCYFLSNDHDVTRKKLQSAHNAKTDILLTGELLHHILAARPVSTLEELYELSCNSMVPSVMTFGKYTGTALVNLPPDYVAWLLRQDNLNKHLRRALENRKGVKAS